MSEVADEMDFVEAFRHSWKRIQRLSEKNLASIGVTPTEIRILRSLSNYGASPMARLASELFMTPASITGLVDKLEGEKLMARERASEDRRVVNVTITQKGRDVLEAGLKLNNQFVTNALKSLSKDESQQLVYLLNKLAEAAGGS